MKTYNKILLAGCLGLFGLTACVNDLNVTPKDPNTETTFHQDAVFTKIYSTLALTGQQGPDGDGDVDGIDEGTASFYRMTWELNEFPTDAGYWVWSDVGLPDIRDMNWTPSNSLVAGLYYRLYFDITLCNKFLDETKSLSDTKTQQQRAEVRMIRAINYWYLLDMFGSVPFVEAVSLDTPQQVTRVELYNWLENELLELSELLPTDGNRLAPYRVDQVTAWMYLMRIYLNAEVYTGTAQWDKAAEYAAKVMNSSYKLHTTSSSGKYSAYQELFMGDNNTNGAQDEAILMIYQDGNYTESWGGSRFLVNTFRDAGMQPSGSDDSWTCFRSSPEMVSVFVNTSTTVDSVFYSNWDEEKEIYKDSTTYHIVVKEDGTLLWYDEFEMPKLLGDDRAIFCSYYINADNDTLRWSFSGTREAGFYACWALCKWTGRNSTDAPTQDSSWPDTDIPFLRVAEAYLTYAEAVYRGGSAVNGTAEAAVKALRDRANNTTPFTINKEFLLDEWQREFQIEGRRRTDMIRFGQFAGSGVTRNWEGRGGANSGAKPKSMSNKYNLYPIPEAEIVANGTLVQTWEDQTWCK